MFAPDFIASSSVSSHNYNDGNEEEVASTKNNRHQQAKPTHAITYRAFLRISPWILVPYGSFNGYFDWVDPKLRVGRWSFGACVAFPAMLLSLVLFRPDDIVSTTIASSACPASFTRYWYYNAAASIWMAYVLGRNIHQEGWAVPYTTFTVWSWTMLLVRHALSAFVIPFVGSDQGESIRFVKLAILIAETLRMPSLLNAVIVFIIWNLIMAPGIYLSMETQDKKRQFVGWLFQFNLLNQHGLNLPLAVMSSVITAPRPFADVDLYFAIATLVAYFAFYLLVLDRFGVHLYPIFSPRTSYCVLIWAGVAVGYYGLFQWVQELVAS